jgi:drug/metabolite transporter (DMT)-like permease
MVVTGGAFLVNLALLLVMRARGAEVAVTSQSVPWLLIAGLAAAGVDLFGLLAYARGLEVTASFIVGGVHTGVILVVGVLILGEAFSWTKLVAILLIVLGTLLLQRASV